MVAGLEGGASFEVGGDGGVDAGHGGGIGEEETEFAVLAEGFGGEVFRAYKELGGWGVVVGEDGFGGDVVAGRGGVDGDLCAGGFERGERRGIFAFEIFLHQGDGDATLESCFQSGF